MIRRKVVNIPKQKHANAQTKNIKIQEGKLTQDKAFEVKKYFFFFAKSIIFLKSTSTTFETLHYSPTQYVRLVFEVIDDPTQATRWPLSLIAIEGISHSDKQKWSSGRAREVVQSEEASIQYWLC